MVIPGRRNKIRRTVKKRKRAPSSSHGPKKPGGPKYERRARQ